MFSSCRGLPVYARAYAALCCRICMVYSEEPNMSDGKAEFLKDYLPQDRRTVAVSCGTHHVLSEPHALAQECPCCTQQETTTHYSCVCIYIYPFLAHAPAGGRREAVLKTKQSKASDNGPNNPTRQLRGRGPSPGGESPSRIGSEACPTAQPHRGWAWQAAETPPLPQPPQEGAP